MFRVFLYPGQGSQKPGMGKDLYENYQEASVIFDSGDSILKRDQKELIFNGDEETLKKTENTQPALFTVEAAITEVLYSKGVNPVYVAGHSLGEYSALYAARIFDFETGLKVVAKRGELMSRAGQETEGAMAAIIGLTKEQIAEEISEIKDEVCVPANENSPEQTVISGSRKGVDTACRLLKEAGAKKAVLLPVSGAFHSPLMKEASEEFKEYISAMSFSDAEYPVISNVTAKPEKSGEKLAEMMVSQLISPVKWVDSMKFIKGESPDLLLETGPGNVLKGLARKNDKSLKVRPCGNTESIEELIR